VGFDRAGNKEFSCLDTAKAFENFHNDDFVRRTQIGEICIIDVCFAL